MPWKKMLIFTALLVVVLLVAVGMFLSFYDFNKLKPMITHAVKAATGRELKIGGEIDLKLGLIPAISAEDVTFQNAAWGSRPELATIKRMEVQVALLPMIKGDYKFIRLVLLEPDVIVETDRSGKTNFEFDTSGEKGSTLPVLVFQDARVENGRFTYKDGKSDNTYSVTLDRLNAVIPGFDKSMQLKFEGAFQDFPLAFEGTAGPIIAWIEAGHSFPVNLTATSGGVSVRIEGEARDPINFKDLSFTVSAEGSSMPEVANWAGVSNIPDLGAFNLKTKIVDPEGKLALEDLDIRIGTEDLAEISLSGGIKNLLDLHGIQLNFMVQGKDVVNLTKLGLPPPPIHGKFRLTGRISDPEPKVYAFSDLKAVLGEYGVGGQLDLNLAVQRPYLTANLNSQEARWGPFNLAAKLTGLTDRLALEKLDLQIGNEQLAQIKLNGTIDDLQGLQGVNLNFGVRGQDLANLKELAGRPLPVHGAFDASGKVTIPVHKKIEIPELNVTVGKSSIGGSLGLDLRAQKPRLSAVLSSRRFNLGDLLIPEFSKQNWVKALTDMAPLKLAVELAGFTEDLAIEQLDLQAGTHEFAEFELKGAIQNLAKQRGINLDFTIRGKNVANLRKFTGQALPIQGAYAASGNINDPAAQNYEVSNLKIVLVDNTLTGRVNVNLAGQRPQFSAELSSQAFNLQPLSIANAEALVKAKRIADLGPLKLKTKVVGGTDKLSVEQIEFEAGTKQLAEVQIKGAIKNALSGQGIDLSFNVQGNEIANLEKHIGQPLPIQGPYAISGRMTDSAAKNYKASDLKLVLGDNIISGWVGLKPVDRLWQLTTELSTPQFNLKSLTIPSMKPLTSIPDLGPFKLAVQLTGSEEKVTVEHLDLDIGTEKLVQVILKGTLKDPLAYRGFQAAFSLKGSDLSNLKKLGIPEIPSQGAFDASGQVVYSPPKTYRIPSLNINIGESKISGWLELNFSAKRPKISAELSSGKIDLRPIYAMVQNKDTDKNQPATPGKKKDKVFSAEPWALDQLKRFDADIKIRETDFLLPKWAFNKTNTHIRLEDGNLEIKPFECEVGGGSASGQFSVNTQKGVLSYAEEFEIAGLNVGRMLEQLGYERSIDGSMDADIVLTGSGNSMAELMAGLNGKFYVWMGDGQVDNKYLDRLQTFLGSDVVRLLNPFKLKRPRGNVNCSVNHIEIKDGIADCKILLDTDQTSILAAGDINLKTEKLNIGIKPTPKKGTGLRDVGTISFSFRQLSKPFRLGGSLKKPALALDPSGAAFAIGKFAGLFLTLGPIGIAAFFADVSLGKKDPCHEALKAMGKEPETTQGKKPKEKKITDKQSVGSKTEK